MVKSSISQDITDAVEIATNLDDEVKLVALDGLQNVGGKLMANKGSVAKFKLDAGDADISVNGAVLTPDADGVYSFTVSESGNDIKVVKKLANLIPDGDMENEAATFTVKGTPSYVTDPALTGNESNKVLKIDGSSASSNATNLTLSKLTKMTAGRTYYIDFDYKIILDSSVKVRKAGYGDAIVISHNKKGAARAASLYATVPVINAGDGGRAYPVKTLSDFSSVWIEKKHVSNMKIGFLGDFTDNVLVKNLLQCLNLYKGNEFYFVSVNGKPLSEDYVNIMDKREKDFVVYDNLFEILPELDVLYMTRVQKERFFNEEDYIRLKDFYILDKKKMELAKEDMLVLHPLPRVNEISVEVDSDPRAAYFRQVQYGVYVRMALILTLLGIEV
mgnify:CR=1 FL=1